MEEDTRYKYQSATLPHDRELMDLISLVMEAYEDSNFLGVVLTDRQDHARFLFDKLAKSVQWDRPVNIFREGIEVKGGGKVIVATVGYPPTLFGLKVSKVVVFGQVGELFYNLAACIGGDWSRLVSSA